MTKQILYNTITPLRKYSDKIDETIKKFNHKKINNKKQ